MGNNEVHVRTGEITSTLAVALSKMVDTGKPGAARVRLEGIEVRTFWSKDDEGFANRVAVKDVMWDASDDHKSLIVILENGEEFEFVAMRSSSSLRASRRELSKAAYEAEKEV